MTREEAIRHLHTYSTTMGSGQTSDEQHNEAKRMAIEALSQPIVAKHFDIQSGYIYCSPQIAENVKVVVQCKDCKHYGVVTKNYGICHERPNVITSQKADDYCSYGERKGGDDE